MQKFKPTNIKGAVDNLPSVQVLRNRVIEVLRNNFEKFGYVPIETATLNYLEVLSYKYEDGSEILREIYKLKDQGDRDLGLRFDLTVPFAKFIATNRNLKMPFRRYEIGKVFRNGPVKAGRNREFYQCDIDVVGSKEIEVEAEQIAIAVKCYLEIGIEPVIKYGNRKLLTELILGAGAQNSDVENIIAIVDKIEKVTKEELEKDLSKFLKPVGIKKLVASFDGKVTHPEVIRLQQLLEQMGIAKYCVFTPQLARGLNVYTGTVWEVFDKKQRIGSSLGGGGRYDKIITEWIDNGLEYPAVGMSFGLEPIMYILEQENAKKNSLNSLVNMLLVPIGTFAKCHEIAGELREGGMNVLVWTGTKVSKAMEYADKENIPYVAVVGEREVAANKLIVKDMKTGKEVDFVKPKR